MGLSKPNGRIRQLGLRPLGPDGAPLSSRLLRSAHRPHPTARMTGRLGRWRRDHHVKGPSAPPRRFRARLASSTSPRAVSHSCSESRARPEVDRRKITHPPAAPPVSIYSPVVSNNCRAMGGEERPASRVVVRSSTWSGKATPPDVQ